MTEPQFELLDIWSHYQFGNVTVDGMLAKTLCTLYSIIYAFQNTKLHLEQ